MYLSLFEGEKMSTEAPGEPPTSERPGLCDRLAVRVDVMIRGGPPLMPVAIVFGITAVGYPVAVMARSLPLALAMIVPLLILLSCLIVGLIRKLYCAANPYVTGRWLAGAWAAFGTDIMTSTLAEISLRRGPDDVLVRRDLVEAIALRRHDLFCARKAAGGIRLSDAVQRV